jgi:ribosome-binding ATPase YchF (GTP1/OBG family)
MLRLALAGKPNAGKSTFFAAATQSAVDVGNYPFTTIDPNRGVATVRTECPCLDRDERCGNDRCKDGKRYVPIELLDVAGLVPGAAEGRGLGNQFLDALTDADAILNVIDASGGTTAEGEPVEPGTEDPLRDVDFVEDELDAWLTGIVADNWETVERQSRAPDFDLESALHDALGGVGVTSADVTALLRDLDVPETPDAWTEDDFAALARAIRERTKPIIVVGNKADVADEAELDALREADVDVVFATAAGERALRQAADAGVVDYDPGDAEFDVVGDLSDEQEQGLEQVRSVMTDWGGTGVQSALNAAVFDRLDRITVYPVANAGSWTDSSGAVLPDAHLLPRGSTPLDLAYAVHSDVGDGYLHAIDARSGREIGEDQQLEEGDVVEIVSTA